MSRGRVGITGFWFLCTGLLFLLVTAWVVAPAQHPMQMSEEVEVNAVGGQFIPYTLCFIQTTNCRICRSPQGCQPVTTTLGTTCQPQTPGRDGCAQGQVEYNCEYSILATCFDFCNPNGRPAWCGNFQLPPACPDFMNGQCGTPGPCLGSNHNCDFCG